MCVIVRLGIARGRSRKSWPSKRRRETTTSTSSITTCTDRFWRGRTRAASSWMRMVRLRNACIPLVSSGTAPRKGTRACISSTRWLKFSAKCSAVGLDARNSFDKKSRDTRLVLTMLYSIYKRSFYLHCRHEILTPLRVLSRLRSRSFGIRCATDRTPRRRPSPLSRAPMRAHLSLQECL